MERAPNCHIIPAGGTTLIATNRKEFSGNVIAALAARNRAVLKSQFNSLNEMIKKLLGDNSCYSPALSIIALSHEGASAFSGSSSESFK